MPRRRSSPRRRGAAGRGAAAAPKPLNLADLRHHIYVMEGALARAVDYGAKQLNREILAVMPGVFMLEGEAQARGVYLDGYGVFFDVRVPMMRQSMVWSLRMMLDQDDAETQAAINELRRELQGVTDPATRASIEQALRQLERQARRPARRATAGRARRGDARAAAPGVGAAKLGCRHHVPRPAPPPADSIVGEGSRTAPTPKP